MRKIVTILVLLPLCALAAYNPFFTTDKPRQKAPEAPVQNVIQPIDGDRKNVQMSYFGFIESQKGAFALIGFNGKNIVVRQDDTVYLDEETFTVKKIASNYLLIADRQSRVQTVYFSSSSGH